MCNFCPIKRHNYRIGVPQEGVYKCVFSTDKLAYGGKGVRLMPARAKKVPMHGYGQSISLTLPAMSVQYYSNQEVTR